MTNETVTIYLNTPLVEIQPKGSPPEGVNVIRGKLLSESSNGLMIQVKSIGNAKGLAEGSPFKKIFIPTHKIDFVSME